MSTNSQHHLWPLTFAVLQDIGVILTSEGVYDDQLDASMADEIKAIFDEEENFMDVDIIGEDALEGKEQVCSGDHGGGQTPCTSSCYKEPERKIKRSKTQ